LEEGKSLAGARLRTASDGQILGDAPGSHNLLKIQKGCRSSRVPIRVICAMGRVFPGFFLLAAKNKLAQNACSFMFYMFKNEHYRTYRNAST
jgi:hypothetical protein